MSTSCPNCGARLTCGCQRRTASNGASVCSNCISSYEIRLQNAKNGTVPNAPTNVGITYKR